MLTGATLGQIGDLLGSYKGFKIDVNTSGRFKYDQRLVVFWKSPIFTLSYSQFPRKVPARLNYYYNFTFNSENCTKLTEVGMLK